MPSDMNAQTFSDLEAHAPEFAEPYPGARLGVLMEQGETNGSVFQYTNDSPADIVAFYEDVAARYGLDVTHQTETDGETYLNARDDRYGLNIRIAANEDGPEAQKIALNYRQLSR